MSNEVFPKVRPTERTLELTGLKADFERVVKKYPELLPVMNEFAYFDPETFKHSVLVMSVGMSIVQCFKHKEIDVTNFGAGLLLHDIGKLGVEKDIGTSFGIIHYKNNSTKNDNGDYIDSRPPEVKESQHRHPLVGGFIIEELFSSAIANGTIRPESVRLWKNMAFSHHEDDNTHGEIGPRGVPLFSYPRSETRNIDSVLPPMYHLMLHMIDKASAMNEPRGYRSGRRLDSKTIWFNLLEELQKALPQLTYYADDGFKEYAKHSPNMLKKRLLGTILDNMIALEKLYKQFDFEKDFFPSAPENSHLIQEAVNCVWEKHSDRLLQRSHMQREEKEAFLSDPA